MTTVTLVAERNANGEVGQVYAVIRSLFRISFVPNMFRVMAHNQRCLKAIWMRVKVVMGPGLINRKTKETIAVAVSAVNGKGCGDAAIVESTSAADLFSGFN